MKFYFAFLLIACVVVSAQEDHPECSETCPNDNFTPVCTNNGEEDKQFFSSCRLEYENCLNRHSNKPEYKPAGRKFCKDSDIPADYSEDGHLWFSRQDLVG